MGYQDDKIADIVNELNIKYFLPDMQRPFVWHTKQVIMFFDSIMRGYPINTFLFWKVKPEEKKALRIYKFIDNYKGDTVTDEVPNKYEDLVVVLDGQQRLTSLLIGLKGSFTIKKKLFEDQKKLLYLNLLKDPNAISKSYDDAEKIYYGFEFCVESPDNDENHFWFRVGKILEFSNKDKFQDFRIDEEKKLPEGQRKIFVKNLNDLYSTIREHNAISFYLLKDTDYDQAMDIFIRINAGGTKLTKSDILLSLFISIWKKYRQIDAKNEIYSFIAKLNKDHKNNFNKDFIMKACLLLTEDLPVKFDFRNFTTDNLLLIQSNWEKIQKAIEKGVILVNRFGINGDTLTSKNALLPIIYYIYLHQDSELYDGKKILTWLIAALLNNVFGGQSDRMLTETRRILNENKDLKEFPVAPLNEMLKNMGKNAEFDEATINNFLLIKYGHNEAFLAVSLLYNQNDWGTMNLEIDHIFAKSLLEKEIKTVAHDPQKQKIIKEGMNCLGNMELLTHTEHEDKGDKELDEWFSCSHIFMSNNQTIEDFKKRHLIPLNKFLFSWNEIPGNDSIILIEFLTQKFGIDWVKTAKIEKIEIIKTIIVSTEKNSLSLKLSDKNLEVFLEIDDGRTRTFTANMENDVLNIYENLYKKDSFEDFLEARKTLIRKHLENLFSPTT